jgi:hypothetical protein
MGQQGGRGWGWGGASPAWRTAHWQHWQHPRQHLFWPRGGVPKQTVTYLFVCLPEFHRCAKDSENVSLFYCFLSHESTEPLVAEQRTFAHSFLQFRMLGQVLPFGGSDLPASFLLLVTY